MHQFVRSCRPVVHKTRPCLHQDSEVPTILSSPLKLPSGKGSAYSWKPVTETAHRIPWRAPQQVAERMY
jgi:hypothetical protein